MPYTKCSVQILYCTTSALHKKIMPYQKLHLLRVKISSYIKFQNFTSTVILAQLLAPHHTFLHPLCWYLLMVINYWSITLRWSIVTLCTNFHKHVTHSKITARQTHWQSWMIPCFIKSIGKWYFDSKLVVKRNTAGMLMNMPKFL